MQICQTCLYFCCRNGKFIQLVLQSGNFVPAGLQLWSGSFTPAPCRKATCTRVESAKLFGTFLLPSQQQQWCLAGRRRMMAQKRNLHKIGQNNNKRLYHYYYDGSVSMGFFEGVTLEKPLMSLSLANHSQNPSGDQQEQAPHLLNLSGTELAELIEWVQGVADFGASGFQLRCQSTCQGSLVDRSRCQERCCMVDQHTRPALQDDVLHRCVGCQACTATQLELWERQQPGSSLQRLGTKKIAFEQYLCAHACTRCHREGGRTIVIFNSTIFINRILILFPFIISFMSQQVRFELRGTVEAAQAPASNLHLRFQI